MRVGPSLPNTRKRAQKRAFICSLSGRISVKMGLEAKFNVRQCFYTHVASSGSSLGWFLQCKLFYTMYTVPANRATYPASSALYLMLQWSPNYLQCQILVHSIPVSHSLHVLFPAQNAFLSLLVCLTSSYSFFKFQFKCISSSRPSVIFSGLTEAFFSPMLPPHLLHNLCDCTDPTML